MGEIEESEGGSGFLGGITPDLMESTAWNSSIAILSRMVKRTERVYNCWNWIGCASQWGYGQINIDGCAKYVHRVAYDLLVGDIPDGWQVDHLCRNSLCWNPEHLEAVTKRENTLRGIAPSAMHARKTHCENGHALTVICISRNTRGCKICTNANRRERYRTDPEYRQIINQRNLDRYYDFKDYLSSEELSELRQETAHKYWHVKLGKPCNCIKETN